MDTCALDEIVSSILLIMTDLSQLPKLMTSYELPYRSAERAYVRVRVFRKHFKNDRGTHLDESKYF